MYTYAKQDPFDIYTKVTADYPESVCGLDPVERWTGCCYSSLDPSMTNGYSSLAIHSFSPTVTLENSVPVDAINLQYCVLETSKYVAYISPSDSCMDGLSCNGTAVKLYSDFNCSSTFQELALNSNFSSYSFNGDTYTAYYKTFNDGILYGKWTSFIPQSYLTLSAFEQLDVAVIFFVVIGIASSMVTIVASIKRLRAQYVTGDLYNLTVDIGIFISLIVYLLYGLLSNSSSGYKIACRLIMNGITNLCFLYIAISSMQMLARVLFFDRVKTKIAIYSIVVLHIVTAGYRYLFFIQYFSPSLFGQIYFRMAIVYLVWALAFLLLTIVPPVLISLKLSKCERYRGSILIFAIIFAVIQGLNGLALLLGYVLRFSTEMIGNDRNFVAYQGFSFLQIFLFLFITKKFHVFLRMLTSRATEK